MKRIYVYLAAGLIASVPSAVYGYWETAVMPGAINEHFIPLAIGDARNGGTNRIYGTEYQIRGSSKSEILEYTWNGSSWDKSVIFSTYTRQGKRWYHEGTSTGFESTWYGGDIVIPTMLVGDGRNDGKNRLYAGYAESRLGETVFGYKIIVGNIIVLEFEWSGSSWTVRRVDAGDISSDGDSQADYEESKKPVLLCLGGAKSDGKDRLYVGTGASQVWEFEWNGSSWTKTLVAGPLTPFEIDGLVVSDGRNDGQKRLYVQSGGYSPYVTNFQTIKRDSAERALYHQDYPNWGPYTLSEYTWNSSSNQWDKVIISSSSDSEILCGGLFVDTGRNDGIRRIYTLGYFHPPDPPYLYVMTTLDKLLKNRMKIIEYTFSDGEWKREIFGFPWYVRGVSSPTGQEHQVTIVEPADVPNFFIATVADARGDGKKRIYVDVNGAWKNSHAKLAVYDPSSNQSFDAFPATYYYGRMGELTWDGVGWEYEEIPTPFIMTFLAGTARNDGKVRAYSAAGMEYSYNKTFSAKSAAEYLVPVNNRFNPLTGAKTSIIYKINEDGNISIKIHTLDGRKVKTLYEGYQYKGEYEIVWNGRNDVYDFVASGIYLVHLDAPGISATKKICVIK